MTPAQSAEPPKAFADISRYQRLAVRFWSDEVAITWSDDGKLASIYLLTNERRTLEGFYRFSQRYMEADLGWSTTKCRKVLAELENSNFLRFDPRAGVILLRNCFRYQRPDNPSTAKGIIRRVVDLPRTPLLAEFVNLAAVHCAAKPGVSSIAQSFAIELEIRTRPIIARLTESAGKPIAQVSAQV
jgi:hypothetical protein